MEDTTDVMQTSAILLHVFAHARTRVCLLCSSKMQ